MAQRPPWLELRDVQARPDIELTEQLDPGEAEALQLALELRAEVLLLDERRGRQLATARGVTVIGALGMLRESYRRRFIEDPMTLVTRLRSHGFRVSHLLVRRFEEQIGELKRHRLQKEEQ